MPDPTTPPSRSRRKRTRQRQPDAPVLPARARRSRKRLRKMAESLIAELEAAGMQICSTPLGSIYVVDRKTNRASSEPTLSQRQVSRLFSLRIEIARICLDRDAHLELFGSPTTNNQQRKYTYCRSCMRPFHSSGSENNETKRRPGPKPTPATKPRPKRQAKRNRNNAENQAVLSEN